MSKTLTLFHLYIRYYTIELGTLETRAFNPAQTMHSAFALCLDWAFELSPACLAKKEIKSSIACQLNTSTQMTFHLNV